MIIITGGSGQLGRGIVERLLGRVPADRVGVSVREPEKARELAGLGVRVRRGDFEDAASLRHAFEGATQVLVVSVNAIGEAAVRLNNAAFVAARGAGARRILYTSHMGVSATSPFAPMAVHAEDEALLRGTGVASTSLRNGFYASTGLMLLGRAEETGELVAPEDGPISWTTHDDLAEATAIVLADEGRLDGLSPPLTGSEAIDLAGLAAIASEITGREIRRVTVGDAEHRASLISHGTPEAMADLLIGLFAASRQGAFAAVDPTLGQVLGRPPITMREFLKTRLSN